MRQLSEIIGERQTANYMAMGAGSDGSSLVMLKGFKRGNGMDQIWARLDEGGNIMEYLIVEAKGINANLAKGQMSTKWIAKKLEELSISESATAFEQAMAQDILKQLAKNPGGIARYTIQATRTGGVRMIINP